jgi:hypothetical protein
METAVFAATCFLFVLAIVTLIITARIAANTKRTSLAVVAEKDEAIQQLQQQLEWADKKLETLYQEQLDVLTAAGLEHAGITGVATAVKQYRSDASELAAELKRAETEVDFQVKRADAIAAELAAANQDRFKEIAKRLACEKELAARFEEQQKQEVKLVVDNHRLLVGYQKIASVLRVLTSNGILPSEDGDVTSQETASLGVERDDEIMRDLKNILLQNPKE